MKTFWRVVSGLGAIGLFISICRLAPDAWNADLGVQAAWDAGLVLGVAFVVAVQWMYDALTGDNC